MTRGGRGPANRDAARTVESDRAAVLIRDLALEPHPEGGHFRELYRSPHAVEPQDGRTLRTALTTIYYLLVAGERSRWHRVASDEVWHFYEGGELELWVAPPDLSAVQRVVLGPASVSAAPTYTVPARWWQAARPAGAYALVGCTVGPGFEFLDFEMLEQDAPSLELMRAHGAPAMELV
jgi:predicted cupin superfamily sugar epimerase